MDEPQLEDITDSDDDSNDSQSDVDFEGDCLKSCEPSFKDRREAALRRKLRIKRLRRNLRLALAAGTSTRTRLREARERNTELQQRSRNRAGTRKIKKTWKAKLAMLLRGNDDNLKYDTLYKLACKEENSSALLHPMLRLRVPNPTELAAETAARRESLIGSARDEPVSVPFRFERPFPPKILVKILGYVLVFPDKPVHVVSRLDEHKCPDETHVLVRPNDELDPEGTNLRLLRRFLIGEGPFSLTYAQKPNELLAPLLVGRQWCYIATNLFYSLNKFCFSSLGELGRFARGIGPRLQRIQDIELFWIGSFEVVYEINPSGRFISRRIQPLSWLPEARRLKRVGIYLRASNPSQMRRRHETLGKVRFDKNHTINQPNFRLQRNMYTIQGMDNMWCLRGTHAVEFWDYDIFLNGGGTHRCIRDHDFVAQMNEITGQPKSAADERMARFRQLCALSILYMPSDEEVSTVESAVHVERERDDWRMDVRDDHDDSGHGTDEDNPGDNDDQSAGPQSHGPPVIVLDADDTEMATPDSSRDAEHDDTEMAHGNDSQSQYAAMDETLPVADTLADSRICSPSLFIGPLSPRRISTTPPHTASVGSVDPESSLFVQDSSPIAVKDDDESNKDDGDGDDGDAKDGDSAPVVQGRRPQQDWEIDDDDDDEEGSKGSDDDDDDEDDDDKDGKK